jgi:hypothetical protein
MQGGIYPLWRKRFFFWPGGDALTKVWKKFLTHKEAVRVMDVRCSCGRA